MNRRELMLTFSALGLSGLAPAAFARSDDKGADLKSAARDAWIFGLPLIGFVRNGAANVYVTAGQ